MSTATANSNPTTSRDSPNDILALQISEALVATGLITDAHKSVLLAKLKAGGVRQEDWSLWIDMATSQQVSQGNAKDE